MKKFHYRGIEFSLLAYEKNNFANICVKKGGGCISISLRYCVYDILKKPVGKKNIDKFNNLLDNLNLMEIKIIINNLFK